MQPDIRQVWARLASVVYGRIKKHGQGAWDLFPTTDYGSLWVRPRAPRPPPCGENPMRLLLALLPLAGCAVQTQPNRSELKPGYQG